MSLKALLLGFNGVVIKNTRLKKPLIDDILIAENLRPDDAGDAELCAERCDRACLNQLFDRRGRVTDPEFLDKLLNKLVTTYLERLNELDKPPIYPGLEDLLYKAKVASLPIAIVTGAAPQEVDWVLTQAKLTDYFVTTVTAQDLTVEEEKPLPRGYEVAIARLNERLPDLALKPEECLAVEAWYPGIAAARAAGIPVVGVAHCHPYRMVQRRADWVVDYLSEIDFDWVRDRYEPKTAA